jgi:hypothetical protein
MQSKLSYTKPSVTKVGSAINQTEGGTAWVVTEVFGRRSGVGV